MIKTIETQSAITCSKLTLETLEQGVKICTKLTIKRPERRNDENDKKDLSFKSVKCF